MKEFEIINPTIIRQSMMNNETMVKQFVDLYLSQCPIDFKALIDSIEQKDVQAISQAAHHIKPTMEYIGASDLRISFQELEKLGQRNAPFTELLSKFEEIKPRFSLMLEELTIFNK